MIVRNESAILERCLLSVLPHIHAYVVCDTGSTDSTVAIVRHILAELPGEVHQVPFEDFAQARNAALDMARGSSLEFDYLLLIDADMELVVSDLPFSSQLSHPGYLLRQISGGMGYYNVRLLDRRSSARYVGATHEYLDLGAPAQRLEGVVMLDHACGSSRSEKTERDLRLLTGALEQNPHDARSLFYLAQTLREAGRFPEAIDAYQRRTEMGGWEEEVWYSRFMIARCHQARGQTDCFLEACLQAYESRPSRAEPLHALAQHYRQQGLSETSALFCLAGLRLARPTDVLFVEDEVYRTGLRHEMSISGYYCQSPEHRQLARRFCAELAVERSAPAWVRENARANWRHYARSAGELFPTARFTAVELPLPEGFVACNPSLAVKDGRLWCVLRSVNYRLEAGYYQSRAADGVIRTQNYLLELDAHFQPISTVPMVEDPPRDQHSRVDGLEDVRLSVHGPAFRCSATIVDEAPDYLRRMVVFDLSEDGQATSLQLQRFRDDVHQKNWVPFVHQGQLGFLGWSDPTTVLHWDTTTRQSTLRLERESPLALEHLRGSSGAIPFDSGWLYLGHEVIHSGSERTYLHRFVHLDLDFRLLAVSEPFYFRKLGVEFCCGLVWLADKGTLLASFGVEDQQAWLAELSAEEVRRQLTRGAC